MTGSKRAQRLVIRLAMLLAAPADAQQAVSFESCAALRKHIDTRQPNEHVLLAPAVYECRKPINPSVDGLTVDFGGSLVRVADQAVRTGDRARRSACAAATAVLHGLHRRRAADGRRSRTQRQRKLIAVPVPPDRGDH